MYNKKNVQLLTTALSATEQFTRESFLLYVSAGILVCPLKHEKQHHRKHMIGVTQNCMFVFFKVFKVLN